MCLEKNESAYFTEVMNEEEIDRLLKVAAVFTRKAI